jgi:uncharacterized protein YegJ (DUF2314 family)
MGGGMSNLSWKLDDGVERNRQNPETFEIPPTEERETLKPGDHVKLIFRGECGGERMWVEVVRVRGHAYVGALRNHPGFIEDLGWGQEIKFAPRHVIDIVRNVQH